MVKHFIVTALKLTTIAHHYRYTQNGKENMWVLVYLSMITK